MSNINSLTPAPVGEVPRDFTDNIEKQRAAGHDGFDQNSDGKYEQDDSSGFKQDGVKRVEAITTVWTKQMLIVMFIL